MNKMLRMKPLLLAVTVLLLLHGCRSTPAIADKTVEIDSFVPQSVVENFSSDRLSMFTAVYPDIESMYADADAVVQGTVSSIEYSDAGGSPLTKLDFIVEESYKGDASPNTEISILEPYGYLRLKTYYDLTQEVYHPEFFTKEDMESGKTVDLRFSQAPEAKVGDRYLFFLLENKPGMYDDKQVVPVMHDEAAYPAGSYTTAGILMGKFRKTQSGYDRYSFYTSLADGGDVSIPREYGQEMPDALDHLK